MQFNYGKSPEEVNYLIYLVKRHRSFWAFKRLFYYYQRLLFIEGERFLNVYTVPVGNRTFYRLSIYEVFYEALMLFCLPSRKTFISFCLHRLKWKLLDIFQQERQLATKLPTLYLENLPFYSVRKKVDLPDFRMQIYGLLTNSVLKLSAFEQKIMLLRLNGWRNYQIAFKNPYSARQIANGWERAKKKLKKYYNNRHPY